jgi:hypothetical protein
MVLLALVGGPAMAAGAGQRGADRELAVLSSGEAKKQVAVNVPAFRRFPAPPAFRGRHAKPKLTTRRATLFRTRLRRAALGKPNYAGRHALALWGCGTNCIDGAAVNLVTGRVVFLPDGASLCFDARLNSRLLMLARGGFGGASEQYAYYDFDGRRFRLVRRIELRERSSAAKQLCRYGVPAFPVWGF